MYSLAQVVINGTPDIVIDQISDWSMDTALQHLLEGGSGSIDNTFVGVSDAAPRLRFTTASLKTALDACGMLGLKIASGNAVEFWLRRRDHGGTFATGADLKLTVVSGLLIPVSIDAAQNQGATIEYELIPVFDGSNSPVQVQNLQTFAVSPTADVRWSVGPAFVTTTRIAYIQSLRVNFGLRVETIKTAAQVFPGEAHLVERAPTIEIETLDQEWLDTVTAGKLGILGAAVSNQFRAFLAKRVFGGTYELENSAVHIRFEVLRGEIHATRSTARHRDNAMLSLMVQACNSEAGNVQMSVSTAAAIVAA